MSPPRIHVQLTEEIEPERWAKISALCEAAFGESAAELWGHLGNGIHVIGEDGGHPVSHAMLVDRQLHIGRDGDVVLDAGYVENVATTPESQGRGYGSAVMEAVADILRDEYGIGALATGSNDFYERLGWETWTGPTSVRMPDGELVRSADDDGHVMILRTPGTPPHLDSTQAVAIDWRPREPW